MLALIVLLVIYFPAPAFPAWLWPGNYSRAAREMGNLMEYVDDDVKRADAPQGRNVRGDMWAEARHRNERNTLNNISL